MFPYFANRQSRFAHLSLENSWKAKQAKIKAKAAAKRPATTTSTRVAPEAEFVVPSFAALRHAADRRRAELPAAVTADERADEQAASFAADMEKTLAIVEGRKPRRLDYGGPVQQAAHGLSDDEIEQFFERRDAARAAPRHDRVL